MYFITGSLALFFFFALFGFAARFFIFHPEMSALMGELPSYAVDHTSKQKLSTVEIPKAFIDVNSTAIVLTADSFLFGELRTFTNEFFEPKRRFKVSHEDGSPQVAKLLLTVEKWKKDELVRKPNHPVNKVVVFFPAEYIPSSLVIQVFQKLKQSKLFDAVVFGGNLK